MAEYKRPPHPLRVLASARDNFFTGKPLDGVNPKLLADVRSAVLAAGGTGVVVTSAKRPPGPGNDVKNSNHITGDALDGYAIIKGQRVPIGTAIKPFAAQFGLRSGDVPGFDPKTRGGYDPVHVDDGANVGGVKPSSGSSSTWPPNAVLAYNMARKAGLNPQQAKDFASVQYGESGFDASNYVGKSNGGTYVPYKTAGGLYQLLSKGYVDTANRLGGIFDPKANIEAILPEYVKYYKTHPFKPGAAGAAVQKSGEGPSYYAQGWSHLSGTPSASAGSSSVSTGSPSAISGVTQQPGASLPELAADTPTTAPAAPAAASTGVVFPPPPARPDIAPPPPSQYMLPGGGPTLPGQINLSTHGPAVAESWQLLAATPGLSPETMSLIHIAGGGGGSQ